MRAPSPHFNGPDYVPELDHARLLHQLERIREYMRTADWRTLPEIEGATGDPPASISAQLRHLRKERFGSWVVEKRRREGAAPGTFEYRLLPPGSPSEYAKKTPGVTELLHRLRRENAALRARVAELESTGGGS